VGGASISGVLPGPIAEAARPAAAPLRPSIDAALTVGAEPAVERRLRAVLDDLVGRSAALPALDAILLGGSLAWGEATADVDDRGGVVVGGDIEAYLVGRSRDLRRHARSLSIGLSAAHGLEVNVAWLHPRRLATGASRNVSIVGSDTILGYELATAARLLHGTLPAIRPVRPETIPVAEGVRLILNRAVEGSGRMADPAEEQRWLGKLLMAAADTLLLLEGSYHGGYRDRLRRVEARLDGWSDAGLVTPDEASAVVAAYRRKLGERGLPASDPRLVAAAVDRVLRHALRSDLALEYGSYGAFVDRFSGAASSRAGYLRYHVPLGLSRYFEASVVAARGHRAGLRSGAWRWASVVAGRPLSLEILGAGAPLLFATLGETALGPLSPRERDSLRLAVAAVLRRAGAATTADEPLAHIAAAIHRAWLAIR
jgi:hypothetical protein